MYHNIGSSKSVQCVGHILISLSLLLLLCFSDDSRLDSRAWIEPPEMTKVSVCWWLQFAEPPGNLLKGILKTEKNKTSCDKLL